MSRQIGPIHYLMYEKIKYQEYINQNILKNLCSDYEFFLDSLVSKPAQGELAEIIDFNNVHGWLANQIDIVETRYAHIVANCLQQNIDFKQIVQIVADSAKSKQINEIEDAVAVLEFINRNLLDGMPCDQVVHILDANSNKVIYQIEKQVHASYWQQVNLSVETYFYLRQAWISAWINNQPFTFNYDHSKDDPYFVIEMQHHKNVDANIELERISKAYALYQKQCDHEH